MRSHRPGDGAIADQIGQGNLAVRTDLAGEDEIGRLGQAFNHMAEDLSKLYQNLEARVEDDLVGLAAVLGDDLGGDVPPPDDGQ